MRDERKLEVEQHVESVKRLLRESGAIADPVEQEEPAAEHAPDEWHGLPDKPDLDVVDQEDEYVDEDRYTTVTIESVSVSRDGLSKPPRPRDHDEEDVDEEDAQRGQEAGDTSKAPSKPKKRKKKFRYETKIERQLTERKRRAKSKK